MPYGKVTIIGSGFSGLSAACHLAQGGISVTVIEKHSIPGGRARIFEKDGFRYDMGPSWYWMPDVFEHFFGKFGKRVSDYYDLRKLSPAFSVVFDEQPTVEIPAEISDVYTVFENIEKGSASRLKKFLKEAEFKYNVGMQDLVYKPGLAWSEFIDLRLFRGIFQLGVFSSYAKHVRKYFRDTRLIRIMEFPVLFLGGTPSDVPALYSLMAYAGLALGTWYPDGGMYKIIEGMHQLALSLGVEFQFNTEVTSLEVGSNGVRKVISDSGSFDTDAVVASADYHHVEQDLLAPEYRVYSSDYWDKRVMAPSAVIYYLGVNQKLPGLGHHTLFFDAPFDVHVDAIYGEPGLPDKPLFYVCMPSVTDETVAPAGCENLFILIPLSTRIEDSTELREACFKKVMDRLENYTGESIRQHLIVRESYAMNDFVRDYHAHQGNAYGLANTLLQTAVLKPRIHSKKVSNLFFAGQLTVPGPGVPPALISGEIAANLILGKQGRSSKQFTHAAAI